MTYVCKDRGTEHCPCALMATGQCYTCNMIKTGRCDCLSGWQGVCPYTEFYQNGKKTLERRKTRNYEIKVRKDYSKNFKVIILETPAGFALNCKEMGTFLMIHSGDFSLPLSVTWSHIRDGKGFVHLAFYITGPKTKILEEMCVEGETLSVDGPFYNGLINSEAFDFKNSTIAIAKGMGVMPLINQRERIEKNLNCLYLDKDKLTEEFIKDYMGKIDFLEVNLREHADEIFEKICNRYEDGAEHNLLLMVSPYYVEKFSEKKIHLKNPLIYPNHSNMCCGYGMCGACSFTDAEGVTVKKCKCNREIKKRSG